MKRIVKLLFLTSIVTYTNTKLFGQSFWDKSEIGFSVGGMKYLGGEPSPSMQFSGGILGKYLLSNKLSIRGQLLASTLVSNTGAQPTLLRPENKEFKLNVLDITIMPEYDLIDISDDRNKFTPYIFMGVGYFYYKTTYRLIDTINNTSETNKYPRSKVPPILNIPVGVGVKYAISQNIKAFAEGSFRLYLHQELYSFAAGLTFNFGLFSGNGNQNDYNKNWKPSKSQSRLDCPPVYL